MRTICQIATVLILAATSSLGATLFYISFDVPGLSGLNATGGISNAGVVVGHQDIVVGQFGATYGWERLANGSLQTGISDPSAAGVTQALGVNSAGTIVGVYGPSVGPPLGFVLSAGVFTDFSLGSLATHLNGINDNGDFVGRYGFSSFIKIGNGSPILFGVPGAPDTEAWGVNDLDQVVGSFTNNGGWSSGFIRNADGTFTIVDVPGATQTWIYGINDSGVIAGCSWSIADNIDRAFYGTPGNLVSFEIGGGTCATGINNSGQIVGTYSDANFIDHGFIATIAPEPSSILLSGAGIALLAWLGLKGRRALKRH